MNRARAHGLLSLSVSDITPRPPLLCGPWRTWLRAAGRPVEWGRRQTSQGAVRARTDQPRRSSARARPPLAEREGCTYECRYDSQCLQSVNVCETVNMDAMIALDRDPRTVRVPAVSEADLPHRTRGCSCAPHRHTTLTQSKPPTIYFIFSLS